MNLGTLHVFNKSRSWVTVISSNSSFLFIDIPLCYDFLIIFYCEDTLHTVTLMELQNGVHSLCEVAKHSQCAQLQLRWERNDQQSTHV